MAIQVLALLLFTLNLDQIQSTYTEVVKTKSGKVRGEIQQSSIHGISVQKFLNIPYAEAPIGQLRFEKPQPKKPWNGTLNSTETRIACFQKYSSGLNLTEDCLVLNIWVPFPTPTNATVMVYIHSGSFTSGDAQQNNGVPFVAVGDVILVTMNYRLSVLGFLTTGDTGIKGNFGLYDQRLAMKWVKENIAAFGGNPKTITLFGLSAGAASVSAHTLSEGSWPYFDRVILQSGNMLNPWTVLPEAEVKNVTNKVLKALNCTNDENVLTCLKTKVTQEMLQKIYTTQPFSLQPLQFSPSVDQDFLEDHPSKLFGAGRVKNCSIILGVTKDEMYYQYNRILWQTRNITAITQEFEHIVRTSQLFKDKPAEVSEYAIELYLPKCIPTFLEALRPTVDIASDFTFTCGIRQEAILRSKMTQDVYLYRYSYATPVPYSAYPQGQFGFAAHGADLLSSFGSVINNPTFPAEDQILSLRIILYWTNFAKTGNPNVGKTKLPLVLNNVETLPTWPPHSSSKQEYLDMRSLSQMVNETKLREKYCEFLMNPEDVSTRAKTNTGRTSTSHTRLLLLLGIALSYYNF